MADKLVAELTMHVEIRHCLRRPIKCSTQPFVVAILPPSIPSRKTVSKAASQRDRT